MTAKVIDRFAGKAPAATMFVGLLSYILSDERLDSLFLENSEHQVESPILFSYLVTMLTPVVMGKSKAVNTSHRELGLDVSRQAVYDKLKGVEAEVSTAMIQETSNLLLEVCKAAGVKKESVIRGYECYAFDGKTYNATEHRLVETRTDSRSPLPGRCISMLNTSYGLFVDFEGDCKASRCERKIFHRIAPRLIRGAVYIGDRNFCDGAMLEAFFDAEAFFVVRLHSASPARREIAGSKTKRYRNSNGELVTERQIEVDLPTRGWTKVRLISVHLSEATRHDERVIETISNLPMSVRAVQIAAAYRNRWTIENSFGYISKCLNAEIRTLCYPNAAGLCFALALLLYNVMRTIMLLFSKFGQQPTSDSEIELSMHYIASEISGCYAGLIIATDQDDWAEIQALSKRKFVEWLKQVASHARLSKYKKDKRGPKNKPPKRAFNGSRHVATQAILEAR